MTAVMTAILFSAVIFSACKKSSSDPCSGITCLNGGTCNGGTCSCPTGYSGTFCGTIATTSIQYNNKAYTPIIITVNGTNLTIPVGGSASYTGTYNSTMSYTAYTYMTTVSGTQIGSQVNWGATKTFPSSGILSVDLDVDPSLYFLEAQDNSTSLSTQTIYVNYGSSPLNTINIIIPNDGMKYGLGYYSMVAGEDIHITSNPTGYTWDFNPIFSGGYNESFTCILY